MFGLPIGKVRISRDSPATLLGHFAFINEAGGQMEFVDSKDVESGFDVVIGNPPYIRIQTLKQKNPEMVDFLKEHYESARKGNYDIYVVFVERGLQLLKPTGNLAYILPHKFFNAQYGEPLRTLIARGSYLSHVVHFGDQQVFPGATNYVCLFFLSRSGSNSFSFVKVKNLDAWLTKTERHESRFPAHRVTSSEWNFAVGPDAKIFEILSNTDRRIGDFAERISQGIRTSANEVYVLDVIDNNDGLLTAYSRQSEREVLLETKSVFPFLQGKEIKPFSIQPSGKVVIIPYEFRNGRADLIHERDYRKRFPRTFDYLLSNKKVLENREAGRMRGENWYAYIYPKNLDIMSSPKLLVPDIANKASFAFDEGGRYAFTSGYGITLRINARVSPKFILGLANSHALDYYWRQISTPLRGGFYRYFTQFIEQLPIPTATLPQQAVICNTVEYLLSLNRSLATNGDQTPKLSLMQRYFEQILNGLVYELFFAEELHRAKLYPLRLVEQDLLRRLSDYPDEKQSALLRETFRKLYDTNHSLRGCLHDLGSLDIVRIIEGRS
jgi:hypothetical protein